MGAGKSNIEKFKDNVLMVIGLLFILTVVVAPVLWWAYWSFINLTIPLISNTWNHEEIVIFLKPVVLLFVTFFGITINLLPIITFIAFSQSK